jgi:two-component system heavy metal sensor histidine kinase CusS
MTRFRRMSLTLRLTLLFLVAAAAMFSITAVCFNWTLNAQLQMRDDRDVLETVEWLRARLRHAPSIGSIRQNPEPFLDVAAMRDILLVAIYDAQEKTLIASLDEPRVASASALRQIAEEEPFNMSDVQEVTLNGGARARALKATARLGDGSLVELVVAREGATRVALQAHYHMDLISIVALGTILSALLGVAVARAGLRPLRSVVRVASRISAERLDERFQAEGAPTEVAELAAAFNGMLARLDDSFRRLSQFSADLAHDFRTPLSNLMVQTQVSLSHTRTLVEYQTLLESNLQEYERLARMVENMLFLARADHAQVTLHKEPFALKPALEKIAEYFDGLAVEADVVVKVDATDDEICADRLLFERAVSNLVANAIRFTSKGETVWLRGGRDATATAIEVSNLGTGIRPEHLDRLFDRFYRADPARDGRSGSAGLGLAIVKSIMTLHGGQVTVASAAEGLTSFRLSFPTANDRTGPVPAGQPDVRGLSDRKPLVRTKEHTI